MMQLAEMEVQSDDSITAEILPLPDGKVKHFFISFCNEDNEKILPIIDELENRFKLQCMYADRDFQPGKDIAVNIREGMMMSSKVLLFLSPRFLQSGWCKYETDAAFVNSMGCGYSCIVPVLLEECEIPPTLVTLTYIDATIPGIDIPSKIASSLVRPNTDDGLLALNVRSWNRTFENGYCHIIEAERDDLWSARPARYRFKITPNLLDTLKNNGVELPKAFLKNAFNVVNKHPVMWSYDYLSRCKNMGWNFLIWIPFCILLYFLVDTSLYLQYGKRQPPDGIHNEFLVNNDLHTNTVKVLLYFGLAVWCLLTQITVCFIPKCCYRKARDASLQSKLWKKTQEDCLRLNILLLFTPNKNRHPTMHIMRYNVARCKEYLIGILTARNIQPVDTRLNIERYADSLIEKHLDEMVKILPSEFELLPDAPMNRHNVKLGKMCICQQIERMLI
ncbi:hypothetical protein ACF0H5_015303 [Mactra antiquata]